MLSIHLQRHEFQALLKEALRIELEIYRNRFLKHYDSEILSRKRAALVLDIDLSTIHDWTKNGILKSYRVGARGRVYYKRSEILLALIPVEVNNIAA